MLDIKFIRENADAIKESAKNKNIKVDIDELLKLDEKRRGFITQIEELQQKRNEHAASMKGGKPTPEQTEEGKKIKEEIQKLEEDAKPIEEEFLNIMVKVPTIPSEDTPIGKDDSENVEVEKHGEIRKFDFEPLDHLTLGKKLDILDMERGAKVAGYRGYYIKNEGTLLQMAFMMYALHKMVEKGFGPMIPPTLVKEYALFGSGYFGGKEYDPKVDEIYQIANDDIQADGTVKKENKFLVGTAEPSLLAYYSDEILKEEDLPIKVCGFSQCYRSEIGSYGKDVKGLYRVHEFMKVEQVCLTKNDVNESTKMHEEMIAISKEMHEELGLPYRQLAICTGDMGAGKYKQYDLEAWIPSRNGYGETGSASNFLDWQARRLNVRYKTKDGKNEFVHMINNTALPSPRIFISIIENYQNEDGSITIPEVLRLYMGGKDKIEK